MGAKAKSSSKSSAASTTPAKKEAKSRTNAPAATFTNKVRKTGTSSERLCGNCGQPGHRADSCDDVCGVCGSEAHKYTSCDHPQKWQEARRRAKQHGAKFKGGAPDKARKPQNDPAAKKKDSHVSVWQPQPFDPRSSNEEAFTPGKTALAASHRMSSRRSEYSFTYLLGLEPKALVEELVTLGFLLPGPSKCSNCNSGVTLYERTDTRSLGSFLWVCEHRNNKSCKQKWCIPVTRDSLFEKTKLSLHEVVTLLFAYAMQTNVQKSAHWCGVSDDIVSERFTEFRKEIAFNQRKVRDTIVFSGEVECDESLVWK